MNLVQMKRQAVPLHAEVAAMLRHQIMSGDLTRGEQLPPLRELTEKLGVARMTVIQAMGTLVDEGLIERFPGRGTFVKDVQLPTRRTLKMKAKLSELHSMVDQLEVSVEMDDAQAESVEQDGILYRHMQRIHTLDGKPFCRVDLHLEDKLYQLAPKRFAEQIVVSVLKNLGISVSSARQRVTISYASVETAQSLQIDLNSPVFRVFREFFDDSNRLIYSANLTYPGDNLEFDIEFSVDTNAL